MIICEFKEHVQNRPYEKPKVVGDRLFIMARNAEEARQLAIPKIPDYMFRAGTNRIFVREFLDESLSDSVDRDSSSIDIDETTQETP